MIASPFRVKKDHSLNGNNTNLSDIEQVDVKILSRRETSKQNRCLAHLGISVMQFVRQVRLLLWKNWLIQRRQLVWSFFELLLPIVLTLILTIIRQQVVANHKNVTLYDPFLVSGDIQDLARPVDDRIIVGWCFHPNILLYTPENDVTHAIMNSVRKRFPVPDQNATQVNETYSYYVQQYIFETISFPTEEALLREIKKGFESAPPCQNKYLGAVVFQDGFTDFDWNLTHLDRLNGLKYKIRLSNSARNGLGSENDIGTVDQGWYTNILYPIIEKLGPRREKASAGGTPEYWFEGFLTLQRAIDVAIIQMFAFTGGYELPFVDKLTGPIALNRLAYPAYVDNPFILVMQRQLPTILVLSFTISVLYIIRNVVKEKEKHLKEYLRVMGMSNLVQWTAYFIISYVKLTIASVVITIMFTFKIGGVKILDNIDPSVFFCFLMVYCAGIVCYCFAVSVFFKAGNTAAACGGIIWFIIAMPYNFLQPRYAWLSKTTKILSCLLFNTGMSFGGQIIGAYEGLGVGLHWSNMGKPAGVGDNLSMAEVIGMMILDIVICIFITWYVEAVFPGDEGVPQPWYFPVKKSYWFSNRRNETAMLTNDLAESYGTSSSIRIQRENFGLDKQDSDAVVTTASKIVIKGLTKIYGKGNAKKLAVDNLDLNMYFAQLTVLLGHNGAGKSTTMAMLTGMLPPSSGTILINGYDISTHLAVARKYLGLCPQHDVLFGELTVDEHLKFFCTLKGRRFNISEVDHLLSTLGLDKKRKDFSRNLSGGMKRKLCLAIALIGGSEIVMLDEPTSGMDPGARHDAWHLLQQEKRRRTILFTTHYMEEADLLGDRIAILAHGRLQCYGSSMFLKRTYGNGYIMTAIFKQRDTAVVRTLGESILKKIWTFIPDAHMQSCVGAEAVFILPTERRGQFSRLFAELEKEQAAYDVSSFGISVTTMEEVFIRVCEKADAVFYANTENYAEESPTEALDTPLNLGQRNSGATLAAQHFYAMIVKRFIHSWRNWLVLFVQLVVPVAIITITVIINDSLPGPIELPELSLTRDTYEGTTVAVYANVDKRDVLMNDVVDSYLAHLGGRDVRMLSHGDMVKYVVNSVNQMGQAQFDLVNVIASTFVSLPANQTSVPSNITTYFNNQAYHGPAVAINVLDNALLRVAASFNKALVEKVKLTTVNHPLPPTKADEVHSWDAIGVVEYYIAFNLVFAMSFLSSSFVVFLLKERINKAKHLQLLGGVHPVIFWLATWTWDFINYMLTVVALMLVFVWYDVQPLIGIKGNHWLHILLLFILYGWASLPLTYVTSFIFGSPAGAFVKLTIFNIFSGLVAMCIVAILKFPLLFERTADALNWICMALFPGYSLGQGIQEYYGNVFRAEACEPFRVFCKTGHVCCDDNDYFTFDNLRWDPPGIGRYVVSLFICGWFYFFLLALFEFGHIRRFRRYLRTCFRRSNTAQGKASDLTSIIELDEKLENTMNTFNDFDSIDDDVACENERIANWRWRRDISESALVADSLEKKYGKFVAVDKLSFAVKRGECFGLLGVNGAGKTSTFRMLTGENDIDDGDAFINGISIRNNWRQAGMLIGYCPQYSAVIDQMTAAEMLTMFARIRGIREQLIRVVVKHALNSVGISEYADKQIITYSGGTKRKLSLAIGLIGNPAVLMLDEPTSGVDPASRRVIWRVLSYAKQQGVAVLLTSHSMDECEALCGRLAIMVAGRFRCMGSPQHLKSKFGGWYTLLVRLKSVYYIRRLVSALKDKIPGIRLKETHGRQASFRVPVDKNSLSSLFGAMEELISTHGIADYSVSQTSLEEIFLNFAKQGQSTKQEQRDDSFESYTGEYINQSIDNFDENQA